MDTGTWQATVHVVTRVGHVLATKRQQLSFWGFSFALGHGVSFLVGSNILLWMVVQQLAAILEFSQEQMSAHSSTLSSCYLCIPSSTNSFLLLLLSHFSRV